MERVNHLVCADVRVEVNVAAIVAPSTWAQFFGGHCDGSRGQKSPGRFVMGSFKANCCDACAGVEAEMPISVTIILRSDRC